MRLPSWKEFLEKEEKWEKHIQEKINENVGDSLKKHPLLDMAFRSSLDLLPPPLSGIAEKIYNNTKGSSDDRLSQVLSYFNELKNKGEQHYEIVANKIDSTLVGIQDLKDIGNDSLKIQEALVEDVKNIDGKIDEIKKVLKDDHSAIMQPRWEKEKSAFTIGVGLVSFVSYSESWLKQDMFLDLCANVGFVNLNIEEINTIFDPDVDRMLKLKLVDNFRKKADLNIDRDLGCALNIGSNFALFGVALNSAIKENTPPATFQKTIQRPYQSILERIGGLNKSGAVYNAAKCLLQVLEPYMSSSNEIQDIEELLEKLHECARSNILGSKEFF